MKRDSTDPEPIPEDELVYRACAGDRTACDALFRRCSGPLRRWLQKHTGQQLRRAISISDLAQETFLGALSAMRGLPGALTLSEFEGVLFQHARWQVWGHAKRLGRFAGESLAPAGPGTDAPPSQGTVTRRDELAWMRSIVARLPLDQARVIELRLDGVPFDVVAERLEITEEAARKRFLRGSLAIQRMARQG